MIKAAVQFKELKGGDAFLIQNTHYIKVAGSNTDGLGLAVVSGTGQLKPFKDTRSVEKAINYWQASVALGSILNSSIPV